MDKWLKSKANRPPLREPVWGYGCDGTLLAVCRLYEFNHHSKWDLGKDKAECWCVLRANCPYEEGELLPIGFITHWLEYDSQQSHEPVLPEA